MELTDYLDILRRYWKVITVAGVLGAILGGLAGTFLRSEPATEYTATVQAVLLTPDAREVLETRFDTAESFTATSRTVLDIPSAFDQVATNDDYTKSRIPTFTAILTSDAVLAPLAQQAGVDLEDFRKRVTAGAPGGSTAIDITVADPNPEQAVALTEELTAILQTTVPDLEQSPVRFETFGVRVDEPEVSVDSSPTRLRQERAVLARQLVESDPTASIAAPAAILSLFDNDDVQRLIDDLGLLTTTDQLIGSLELSATDPIVTAPTTTTEETLNVVPTRPGSVSFSITDFDRDQALAITEGAMELLRAKVDERYGITGDEPSPLLITDISVAQDSILLGTGTGSGSRTLTNVILGLLIGLAIGVGYAFFKASQDTTIRTVRQLVELTGSAPFGVIDSNPQAAANPWIELDETARAAEGYRALRSSLIFGAPHARVLTLTSPTPGGGTQTVGINLAIALAQAGQSVCVMEAALRNPRLAAALTLQTAPGLTDVLARRSELDASLQTWEPGNITVLTAGAPAANPSELLTSQAMATTIETLRSRFDYVICLTTAAQESTDPAVVGRRSDGVLLVLRHDATTSTQLEAAASSLLQVGAPIAGTVLNDVPAEESLFWRVVTSPTSSSPTNDQSA